MMFRLSRHWRFLAGAGAGVAAGLLVPFGPLARLLIGADVLFGVYLAATVAVLPSLTAQALRHHAQDDDEGIGVILLLALLAAGTSLVAIFGALNDAGASPVHKAGAMLSVPLGWLTLHTLFAFRYAHLWYAPSGAEGDAVEEGLDFGGACTTPGLTEFLYYSLTIGMTAQTSDVAATNTTMRRLTLFQAVISFFYNTVLIALTVSAGLSGT